MNIGMIDKKYNEIIPKMVKFHLENKAIIRNIISLRLIIKR